MTTTPKPEFDQFAGSYEEALGKGLAATGESQHYFAEGRIQWVARQLTQLNFRPKRILDFGCGTGSATRYLLAIPGAAELAGVDISEASLKTAAEDHHDLANAKFATFAQSPPKGDTDLIFCNGVFHHIPPAERPDSVRYIYDSLRPGGLFALCENNPWNPGTRLVMSRIPFDRDAITLSPPETRRMVISAGLEYVKTRYLFFFPNILRWMRWMDGALEVVPLGGQYIVLCRKPGG